MNRILVVDDDEALRNAVQYCLRKQGYTVVGVESADQMFDQLSASAPDLLLLDVFLGDGDSMRHLSRLRGMYPALPIIMVTGSGTIDMAVEAIRRGVYDFITKPVDTRRLITSARRAIQLSQREDDVARPSARGPGRPAGEQEIWGESSAIRDLRTRIGRVADSTCTVLVVGETGTGKELVAEAIHAQSPRAKRELPVVNCGALPSELVESEVFGHEKGAFTGATQSRIGYAEQAHESSLFLDEIGEMPVDLQAKLLRFLQDKSFHRVGGTRTIRVDTRVICATNRDPAQLVREGRMREDLYYRISPVTLRVPPLRERKADIPLLAERFLLRAATVEGKAFRGFAPETVRILADYHWPGNVRHLLNVITEVVVLHDGDWVTQDMLPADLTQSVSDVRKGLEPPAASSPVERSPVVRPLWEVERTSMQTALDSCEGNVALAAHQLEVSAATLYRKIKRYNLRVPRESATT